MLLLLRINLDSAPVANAGSSGQGFLFLTHLLQGEYIEPPVEEFTGGSFARVVKAKKKKRRNVEEDEVLMFMM